MLRLVAAISLCALISACSQGDDYASAPVAEPPPQTGRRAEIRPDSDLILPLPENTQAEITVQDMAVRIAALADDAFEGRGPAGETGEKTADWIAAEMARIGLQPAGEAGSFFQTVGMVEQALDTAASSLKLAGKSMTLGEDAVLWTKKQDTDALDWNDSKLVFVGYGVVAPEYGWDDYAGLDVAGKTVVMLINDPGYARGDSLFKGKAMTYYGRWTYKFEEAGRQGATGAIIIHETAPASYGWDVVSNSWSGVLADLVRKDGGASRTDYEAWIPVDRARALFSQAGLDFDALKLAAQEPGFQPVPMGGLTASGSIVQTLNRTESRNVLGRVTGTTAPDEHVAFMAHWDHLGKKSGERAGEPTQDFYRDTIFNGAVDNATGTAAMLEMAEAMANTQTERSAIFMAVTLEESGLLGSAYYAENPTVPLHKIVAGINIDAMLPVGPTRDMVVIGYGASELEDILKAHLDTIDRVIVPDLNPEAGYFYRSDHVSFAKKGVPMLYADNGLDTLEGGIAVGRAFEDTYRLQRYHKPMDEYDPASWNLLGMVEDVQAMYAVGLHVAQSDAWPSWYAGNEFEAIRQASLASADD